MNIKITSKDIIWSYISYIIKYLSNIVFIPLMTVLLTQAELGLWYTFISVGAIALLLDFGFLPCITRNISYVSSGASSIEKSGIPEERSDSSVDYNLLKKIIISSRWIYFFIAFLVLLLSISIGTLYIKSISDKMFSGYNEIAWYIYAIALFLNVYFSYWMACLRGIGAIKHSNMAIVISETTKILLGIILLISGFGILGLAISYMMGGILLRLLSKKYFNSFAEIEEYLSKIDTKIKIKDVRETIKLIWPNAWKQGIVSLCGYVITQGNTLLCSYYLGLKQVAVYGLIIQISTAIASMSTIMFNSYSPKLSQLHINKDKKNILKTFSFTVVVFWVIMGVGTVVAVFIGIPILGMIKSNTIIPVSMLVFMLIELAIEYNQSIFVSFIATSNKVPSMKSSVISSIATFILSFFLVRQTFLGIWSLLIGRAIVELSYGAWRWVLYVLKELRVSLIDFILMGINELKILIISWFNHYKLKLSKDIE